MGAGNHRRTRSSAPTPTVHNHDNMFALASINTLAAAETVYVDKFTDGVLDPSKPFLGPVKECVLGCALNRRASPPNSCLRVVPLIV